MIKNYQSFLFILKKILAKSKNCDIIIKRSETAAIYRGVEQLVARRAHNPEVAGSSPVPATKKSQFPFWETEIFLVMEK